MQETATRSLGDYVIRRCSEEDLPQVVSVNLLSLPEHYSDFFFEELLRDAPESFLVAENQGHIVGYIMCRVEYGFSTLKRFALARKGHIVSIAVLDAHRRKGLGRTLVEEALEGFRMRGCIEAYLEVRCSNTAAQEMYKTLGFKVSERITGYYRDGEAAYQMSLPLATG